MKKQLNTDIHAIVRRDNEYGIEIWGVYPSYSAATMALPGVFQRFLVLFSEGNGASLEEVSEGAEYTDDFRYTFDFDGFEAEFQVVPLFPDSDTAEAECRQMLGDIFGFEEKDATP